MSFELTATLRRLKPDKRTRPLARRADRELPFVGQPAAGQPLLLDTSVYIDVLQGRVPSALKGLLDVRLVNHSSIAVCELVHLFGRLDPVHPDTPVILAKIKRAIDAISPNRLAAPSVRAMAEAGIVTGMIARLNGVSRADRQPLLNDAGLVFQALETGAVLVSSNIGDMDMIGQLVTGGRILLYRRHA